MLHATSVQANSLRRHLWTLVNVLVVPPVAIAAFLILIFTYWISSPLAFDPRSALVMLLPVLLLGAGFGAALGLLQALTLRARLPLLGWTLATSGGLALSTTLASVAWILRIWALQPPALWQLPNWGAGLALSGFWLLAVGHGCALAGVQSLALRGEHARAGQPSRRAWLWRAGLTWSLLTPFAYILTESWWQALALALPLPVDIGGLYLPFLLFALPYVVVTARLWRDV